MVTRHILLCNIIPQNSFSFGCDLPATLRLYSTRACDARHPNPCVVCVETTAERLSSEMPESVLGAGESIYPNENTARVPHKIHFAVDLCTLRRWFCGSRYHLIVFWVKPLDHKQQETRASKSSQIIVTSNPQPIQYCSRSG